MIGESIKLKTEEVRDIANVTEALANMPIKDADVKYRIGRMDDYLNSAKKSLEKRRLKIIEDFGGVLDTKKNQYDFPTQKDEDDFNEFYKNKILQKVESLILPRFKREDLLSIEGAPAMALNTFKKLVSDYYEEGNKGSEDHFAFSFEDDEEIDVKKEIAAEEAATT